MRRTLVVQRGEKKKKKRELSKLWGDRGGKKEKRKEE